MNKNINNQAAGKKHSVTYIDVFVWLIILGLLCVGVMYFSTDTFDWGNILFENSSQEALIYVIKFEGLTQEQADSIKLGDSVILLNDGKENPMGMALEVKMTDDFVWIPSESDESQMELVSYPDKKNVFVTVEIENVSYEDGEGYFFNGIQLFVGDFMEFKLPLLTATGECVSLNVKE